MLEPGYTGRREAQFRVARLGPWLSAPVKCGADPAVAILQNSAARRTNAVPNARQSARVLGERISGESPKDSLVSADGLAYLCVWACALIRLICSHLFHCAASVLRWQHWHHEEVTLGYFARTTATLMTHGAHHTMFK